MVPIFEAVQIEFQLRDEDNNAVSPDSVQFWPGINNIADAMKVLTDHYDRIERVKVLKYNNLVLCWTMRRRIINAMRHPDVVNKDRTVADKRDLGAFATLQLIRLNEPGSPFSVSGMAT